MYEQGIAAVVIGVTMSLCVAMWVITYLLVAYPW